MKVRICGSVYHDWSLLSETLNSGLLPEQKMDICDYLQLQTHISIVVSNLGSAIRDGRGVFVVKGCGKGK